MSAQSPLRCPDGSWRLNDVYEVSCPDCDGSIEFFKTDTKRACPRCGKQVLNPRKNTE